MIKVQQVLLIIIFLSLTKCLRTSCSLPENQLFNIKDATNFGATQVTGISTEYAYQFDGIDDYMKFPTLTYGGPLSFTYYVKYSALQNQSRIIDFGIDGAAGTANIVICNPLTTDTLHADFYNSPPANFARSYSALEIDVWQQFIVIYLANGQIKLYKNGQALTLDETLYNHSNPIQSIERNSNKIGVDNWSGSDLFKGIIDELIVYNFELSEQQIQCIQDTCDQHCSTCDFLPSNCTSCKGNRINTSCDCPSLTYDSGADVCPSCVHPCLECDNQTTCKSCIIQDFRETSIPCGCIPGYYNNSNDICQKCPNKCTTCDDTGSCTQCQGPNRKDTLSNCDCMDTYFDNGQECQKCVYPCLNCSSINTCISCQIFDISENRQNTIPCGCKDGYYNSSDSNTCLECQYPCLYCISQNVCKSCPTSEYRINQTQCLCELNYYDNGSNCVECNRQCNGCVNNNSCIKCKDANMIPSQLCQISYIGNFETIVNGNLVIQSCQEQCEKCSDSISCTTCQDVTKNPKYNCSCPEIYYLDSNGVCQQCKDECKSCNNQISCESCQENFVLKQNKCICPSKFIFNKGKCLQNCEDNFFMNMETLQCQPCYYYQNICLEICPQGTNIDENNKICKKQDEINMQIIIIVGSSGLLLIILGVIYNLKTVKYSQINQFTGNIQLNTQQNLQQNSKDEELLQQQIQDKDSLSIISTTNINKQQQQDPITTTIINEQQIQQDNININQSKETQQQQQEQENQSQQNDEVKQQQKIMKKKRKSKKQNKTIVIENN